MYVLDKYIGTRNSNYYKYRLYIRFFSFYKISLFGIL